MHTFANPSEENVPILVPSTKMSYFERPPSPQRRKVGVEVPLAVLSEPTCRFRPHVPSSRFATFVVRAPDTPAKTREKPTTATRASTTRTRHNIIREPPRAGCPSPDG